MTLCKKYSMQIFQMEYSEIRYLKFPELDIPEIRHPDYPEFRKLGINNFRNNLFRKLGIFRNRSAKFRKLETLEIPECYRSVPKIRYVPLARYLS